MKLDAYLVAEGIDNLAFAQTIGRTPSAVSRYRSGKQRPPLEVIARIKNETGGKVSYEDWHDPVPPKEGNVDEHEAEGQEGSGVEQG